MQSVLKQQLLNGFLRQVTFPKPDYWLGFGVYIGNCNEELSGVGYARQAVSLGDSHWSFDEDTGIITNATSITSISFDEDWIPVNTQVFPTVKLITHALLFDQETGGTPSWKASMFYEYDALNPSVTFIPQSISLYLLLEDV